VYITFDRNCFIQSDDSLSISYFAGGEWWSRRFVGGGFEAFLVRAGRFSVEFRSGSDGDGGNGYGYRFYADPDYCHTFQQDEGKQFKDLSPQIIESPHPYCDNMTVEQAYYWLDETVRSIWLVFDPSSELVGNDRVIIRYTDDQWMEVVETFYGSDFRDLEVRARKFHLDFWTGDGGGELGYGYKIYASVNEV